MSRLFCKFLVCLSLFLPFSGVQSQVVTDDGKLPTEGLGVAQYIARGFGLKYEPLQDNMKCSNDVSTPVNILGDDTQKAEFAHYLNCITVNDGIEVIVGWKPTIVKSFTFLQLIALRAAKHEKINFSAQDKIKCTEDSELKHLYGCVMTYASVNKTINYYVYYMTRGTNNFFVLTLDNFSNQKEKTREFAVKYYSRFSQ